MFFSHELKRMPAWFPWMIVGGIIFILLSFIGAKYKEKEYRTIQFAQDFISGSILIAFTGLLIPDVFPVLEWPSAFPLSVADEMDLQVGPPRLAGR